MEGTKQNIKQEKTQENTETFFVVGKNSEGKEHKYKCVLRKPDFKQLSLGLSTMTTITGNLDMAGAGKAIFDVCKIECDKEIEKVPKYMLSLCLKIASEYLDTVEVEIKKN